MDIAQKRNKYITSRRKPESLKLNLDITIMSAFCCYVISDNASIHTSQLVNLNTIFNMVSEEIFGNQSQLVIRYRFCKDALKSRLEKKIYKRQFILRDIIGPIGNKYEELDVETLPELSNNDVIWIETNIASMMDILFINNSIVDLSKECTDYIDAEYSDKLKYVNTIKNRIINMNTQFRRNDIDTDSEDTLFKLSSPEDSIQRIINRINSPSYKLITGMTTFNQIIAGGFEGSRVYCFMGLPGEGKTTTLLNLLYQLKKYNANYICKDPTKRPCIVLLTMENQIHETVCTLYNIACSNDDMSYHSTEEILDIMAHTGLAVTEESPIDIVIKYKPINSVDTNYLFKLTEDLEDDGYEVICLLQDYIKRIRPVEFNDKDERFRLGAVINEFKNYAVAKDIPVITASQINRDGAKTVDDGRLRNNVDIIKKIGRTNIGESSLIDENLDASIFLLPEWTSDNKKYMGFKLTKKRFKADLSLTANIFYQPFVDDNPVKLVEDVGNGIPASKKTLSAFGDGMNGMNNSDNTRFSQMKKLDLDDFDIDPGTSSGFNLFAGIKQSESEPKHELIEVFKLLTDDNQT